MIIKILSIYLPNYWMLYHWTEKTFLVNCLGKVESESNVKLAITVISGRLPAGNLLILH